MLGTPNCWAWALPKQSHVLLRPFLARKSNRTLPGSSALSRLSPERHCKAGVTMHTQFLAPSSRLETHAWEPPA